ncbi:ribonuclease H-like protein [Aspergillus phoenicis ATCC 13157]|uniref:Ribonuclease H-like protein n=2 Tax=Aspergillus TaxID=5052 RepID=A0A370PE11_ASPPH|nr:ribonuclease H-like protein [Aspergillus phoenicis ATCC 13157]
MALREAAMSCSFNGYMCIPSLHSRATMTATRSRSLRRPSGKAEDCAIQSLPRTRHLSSRIDSWSCELTPRPSQASDSIHCYQTSPYTGSQIATSHNRDLSHYLASEQKRCYSSSTVPRPMIEHIIDSKDVGEIQTPETPVLLAKSHTLASSNNDIDELAPESHPPAEETKPVLTPAEDSPTPKFWSHTMLKSPEGKNIIVHYCKTLKSSEEVAQLFLNDKILGLDMEWKAQASAWNSIQDNVSLIQIANRERIALFHVALFRPGRKLSDLVPPSLKQIIESPDITKLGVSIKADCTRLRKYLKVDAHGIFELSHLHKLVKYCQTNPKLINKRPVNLSEQVEEHLGLPLEKAEDVRCSDWTVSLSYRQVQYAASDSYACICLFDTMDAKRKALDPRPPLPAHADLDLPIRIVREPTVTTVPDDVEVVKP